VCDGAWIDDDSEIPWRDGWGLTARIAREKIADEDIFVVDKCKFCFCAGP